MCADGRRYGILFVLVIGEIRNIMRYMRKRQGEHGVLGFHGCGARRSGVGLGAAAGIASNMASTRAPQRPLAQLVDVVSGESHSITSAQVTIGRERSVSDIALRDPNVSRRHAQLTFTGSDWSIEDLNSTNGTLVNNRRITRCPLRNGDLLTFGLSTFEFRG